MFSVPGQARVQRPEASNMFLLIWDKKNNGFVEPMESPWIKMLIKPKEFQWFWRDEGKVIAKMSLKPLEFQWFWCVHSMSEFEMFIKPKEFQWFWCVHSMSEFKMSLKPLEFQWFWCSLDAKPQFENEPNRDLVLRDQKVLPEVRNRLLLLRDFTSYSTFRNPFLI